jgi:hypothetical protein
MAFEGRHEHLVIRHIERIDRRYVVVWPAVQRSVNNRRSKERLIWRSLNW